MILRPQPGPQRAFLSTPADIAIYGGAAGGGKTYAMLLDPLRAVNQPGFSCVFFRRESTQITAAGGAWDKAQEVYGALGAALRQSPHLEARWPLGAVFQFRHLQHETDKQAWMGAELACILFDELTHFTETQFWYLVSRNRSTCGVKPWIRASCNPEPGWVADLLAWWIGEDGYPIPERSGVLRWFVRRDDELLWFDRKAEALEHCEPGQMPRSLTFIAASLEDNPALTTADPGYRSALLSLPTVERERLLRGNWKVSHAGGLYRYAAWEYVGAQDLPPGLQWRRYWDLAATEPSAQNPDPDWTAGALVARQVGLDGIERTFVRDVRRTRQGPAGVERFILRTAEADGRTVPVYIEQEPGASGKSLVDHYASSVLRGYRVEGDRPSGDKVTRQSPLVAEAEQGRVVFVRGDWNLDVVAEAETYPTGKRDQWDAIAGARSVAPCTREPDLTAPATRAKMTHAPGVLRGRAVRPPRGM